MRNSTNMSSSVPLVDGVSGYDEIANLFSSNLQNRLNSNDTRTRDGLLSDVNSNADLSSTVIPEETIYLAFSRLKPGKSAGSGLLSDYLIHAFPAIASS